ncbi:hypothetical protein DMENIID0001_058420 [Sergentomyia squamirostris]
MFSSDSDSGVLHQSPNSALYSKESTNVEIEYASESIGTFFGSEGNRIAPKMMIRAIVPAMSRGNFKHHVLHSAKFTKKKKMVMGPVQGLHVSSRKKIF